MALKLRYVMEPILTSIIQSIVLGTQIKGIYNPPIFTQWFFCSIYFLGWFEAFSPQLVDSNMPLDPSTRDLISLSAAKHRPVFCYCFGSDAREITLRIQKGAFPLQKHTESVILYSESDFPCARIETISSSLGLKCKEKHDLLLGVVYPFSLSNLRKSAVDWSAVCSHLEPAVLCHIISTNENLPYRKATLKST